MATIIEDFVSFETAKLLKEKNCPDFGCSCICDSEGNKAQTQSIIMKWLREVYKISIEIQCSKDKAEAFIMTIEELPRCLCRGISSNTYEEAVEMAIKYCLEHLI